MRKWISIMKDISNQLKGEYYYILSLVKVDYVR